MQVFIPAGGGSRAARVPAVCHAAAMCEARRLFVPGGLGVVQDLSNAGLRVLGLAAVVHGVQEMPV